MYAQNAWYYAPHNRWQDIEWHFWLLFLLLLFTGLSVRILSRLLQAIWSNTIGTFFLLLATNCNHITDKSCYSYTAVVWAHKWWNFYDKKLNENDNLDVCSYHDWREIIFNEIDMNIHDLYCCCYGFIIVGIVLQFAFSHVFSTLNSYITLSCIQKNGNGCLFSCYYSNKGI